MTKHIAWVAVIVAVLGCAHAGLIAQEVPLERLTLPQGFRIDVYASGVENARQMTLSPSGTLFVGTRQAGNVYAVVDDNDDQRADRVLTIASGLRMPSGIAFRDGDLGEFNWSSQHLDDEVLRCRNGNGEGQTGRVGLRCVRLVGRR